MKHILTTLLLTIIVTLSATADVTYSEQLVKKAKAGDAEAQNELGICYANGQGIAQSSTQAVYWCNKAAEQGNAAAQYNIGLWYYAGKHGLSKDYKKATYWFAKSADQNYALAMTNMGVCYYLGQGVEKDVWKAADLWEKAANAGDENAKKNLERIGYKKTDFSEISTPQNTKVEFLYKAPTAKQLSDWENKYHNLCKQLIVGYSLDIPDEMRENDPCLIYLIHESKSLGNKDEKQEWIDMYPRMNEEQIFKLYDILYREMYELNN